MAANSRTSETRETTVGQGYVGSPWEKGAASESLGYFGRLRLGTASLQQLISGSDAVILLRIISQCNLLPVQRGAKGSSCIGQQTVTYVIQRSSSFRASWDLRPRHMFEKESCPKAPVMVVCQLINHPLRRSSGNRTATSGIPSRSGQIGPETWRDDVTEWLLLVCPFPGVASCLVPQCVTTPGLR